MTSLLQKSIQEMLVQAKGILACSSLKQMGQFFTVITDKQQYMSNLVDILGISQSLPLSSRQQLASLLNLFIKEGHQQYDYTWIVGILTRFITDWRVPFQVKSLLHYGFSAVMLYFCKDLDNFFQNLMIVLTNMVQFVKDNPKQQITAYKSQPIYAKYIDEPFIISFTAPTDIPQIYHTILFMLQSMLDNIKNMSQSKQYILSLLAVWRKMLSLIINQDNIIELPSLMKLYVSVWETLMDTVSDQSPSLDYCTQQISEWPELSQQFHLIYHFLCQAVKNHKLDEDNMECYNYLLWTQQWQNNRIVNLKQQTVRLHIRILTLKSQSNLALQLQTNISKHLIASLSYLSINRVNLVEYQINMATSYLSLFKMLIRGSNLNYQSILQIIQTIILPLLQFETNSHRPIFQEDPDQLMKQIENCCDFMDYGSIMSELANIIKQICDQTNIISQQLTKYAIYSLKYNLSTSNINGLVQSTQIITIDTATAFLLLCLLSQESLQNTDNLKFLKDIITPQLYANLDDYRRAYLFVLLSYIWIDIYDDNLEQGIFLLKAGLDQQTSNSLQVFALDFILNACDAYYDEDFIISFVNRFEQLAKNQAAWMILQKIINAFLSNFNEATTCQIVLSMLSKTRQYMDQKFSNTENLNYEDTTKVLNCLNICKCIARSQQYCRDKPNLQNCLFGVTKMLTFMSKIRLDEEVVSVATSLLEKLEVPNAEFISLLDSISETFRNFEFQGMVYFSFFSKFMFATIDHQTCLKLYSITFEGLWFFSSYPDLRVDINQSLNNHILLGQNYLLLHGDKLTKRDLQDILEACHSIFKRLFQYSRSKQSDQIIRARTRNLHVICCLYLNLDLPMQELLVQSKEDIYRQYDAIILVYILSKTQAAFFQVQEQYQLLQLFLNLLKTNMRSRLNSYNDKDSQMRRIEQLKKFNNILRHIDQPIDLELTLQRQINLCLKIFMEKGCRFDQAFQIMNTKDSQDLRLLLQEKEQKTSLPQNKTDLNNQRIKGRKILRVVGKKQRADISMLDNRHINRIRNKDSYFKQEDSDQQSYFQGQKINKIPTQSLEHNHTLTRQRQKILRRHQKQ